MLNISKGIRSELANLAHTFFKTHKFCWETCCIVGKFFPYFFLVLVRHVPLAKIEGLQKNYANQLFRTYFNQSTELVSA